MGGSSVFVLVEAPRSASSLIMSSYEAYFKQFLELFQSFSGEDSAKAAFKKQAILCHPDKPTGSTEVFQAMHSAYQDYLKCGCGHRAASARRPPSRTPAPSAYTPPERGAPVRYGFCRPLNTDPLPVCPVYSARLLALMEGLGGVKRTLRMDSPTDTFALMTGDRTFDMFSYERSARVLFYTNYFGKDSALHSMRTFCESDFLVLRKEAEAWLKHYQVKCGLQDTVRWMEQQTSLYMHLKLSFSPPEPFDRQKHLPAMLDFLRAARAAVSVCAGSLSFKYAFSSGEAGTIEDGWDSVCDLLRTQFTLGWVDFYIYLRNPSA